MKRIILFFFALAMVLGWTSCGKNDYMAFVGTWGVERIDYYNIDFYGQPIENTVETFYFTPGDPDNGIDLVFRNDRTGEMRDRSRDTLIFISDIIDNDTIIDTIICPDTTLITNFTYSYHDDDATLYMNMLVAQPFTYQMRIESLTNNSFVYENEYRLHIVEKAYLVRISDDTRHADRASKSSLRQRRWGSMFSNY